MQKVTNASELRNLSESEIEAVTGGTNLITDFTRYTNKLVKVVSVVIGGVADGVHQLDQQPRC